MVCGNVDHAVLFHLVGIIMSLLFLFPNSMVRIDLFGTFFLSFSWRNNKQYIVRGVV